MVVMDVQLDKQSERMLLDAARKFPREVRRAFYYSCGIALRMMRGRMSGKNKHIARWDDFTRRYREKATWDSAHTFGGKLMWPDKKKLTMEPEGDRVRIGWIGPLEAPAERFQEGGTSHNGWDWRRARVEQGFSMHEVPEQSVTPPRPVIQQVETEARQHLSEWTMSALVRVLDGRIKAWETRYNALSTDSKRGKEVGPDGELIQRRRASAQDFQRSINRWLAELKAGEAKMLPGTN